jgi:adenylate cyclase
LTPPEHTPVGGGVHGEEPVLSDAPFGSRILGRADEPSTRLRVRLQALTTGAILAANVVGAAVVTVLSGWVLPRPEPLTDSMFVAGAVAIPVYVVGAMAIGVVWGTRIALARDRWVLEEREPDGAEQRSTLRTPLALVGLQGALWGVAVPVFTGITILVQPTMALNVSVTVALGGVVTCMAAYLLTEFTMRPVAARALAVQSPQERVVPGLLARWLLAWGLGSGVPVVGLVLVGLLALIRGDVSSTQLAVTMVALGATTILVGLLTTLLSARAAIDPIRALRSALQRVEHGDLDADVVVYDASEIGLLQAGFNRMVLGLRERERIRDLFGRHVGHEVARDALSRDVELGGEHRHVAALFIDIIGSTEMTATHRPEQVVTLLNRFFTVVVDVVDEHHGTLNKFEGDGALAIFGAPNDVPDHASSALRAARILHDRLTEAVPECPAGIGVAAGPVVAGNIGGEARFEYTVIGDPVNEAARLCDRAKETDRRVLASMPTVDLADETERTHWTPAGEVTLRGRPTATQLARPQ